MNSEYKGNLLIEKADDSRGTNLSAHPLRLKPG